MQHFRRAMGELGVSGKLIVTDITDTSPAFHVADEGLIVPTVGRIEYIPALKDIVRKHGVGLLVPLTRIRPESPHHCVQEVFLLCLTRLGSSAG